MTSELQQNRYDQLLRRVGNLKGPGSKVSEVLTELFPTFDVEHLPPELYILMQTDICFGGANLLGAAAERAGIQLFNPVDSSKILTLTSLIVSSSIDQQISWGVSNGPLFGGVGTETFRDTRKGITARPTGQMRTESQLSIIGNTGQIRVLANDPLYLNDPDGLAVLEGGIGFDVGSTTVATTIHVTFYWRERVLEPSEVNL